MPVIPTTTRQGGFSVRYARTGTAPFDVWLDMSSVLTDQIEEEEE